MLTAMRQGEMKCFDGASGPPIRVRALRRGVGPGGLVYLVPIRTVPTQPRSRSVTALGDDATVPQISVCLKQIGVGRGLNAAHTRRIRDVTRSRDVARMSWNVARMSQECREMSRDVPGCHADVARMSQECREMSRDVPGCRADVARCRRNVAGMSRDVARCHLASTQCHT